jgi:hypothetical protein
LRPGPWTQDGSESGRAAQLARRVLIQGPLTQHGEVPWNPAGHVLGQIPVIEVGLLPRESGVEQRSELLDVAAFVGEQGRYGGKSHCCVVAQHDPFGGDPADRQAGVVGRADRFGDVTDGLACGGRVEGALCGQGLGQRPTVDPLADHDRKLAVVDGFVDQAQAGMGDQAHLQRAVDEQLRGTATWFDRPKDDIALDQGVPGAPGLHLATGEALVGAEGRNEGVSPPDRWIAYLHLAVPSRILL